MQLNELITDIATKRAEQLGAELKGKLTWFWNEEKQLIEMQGTCKEVHPDLKDKYPNGWSLSERETLDEACEKLGLTLALQAKTMNPACCPLCKHQEVVFICEWEARSKGYTDNTGNIDEYQCRNEACGISFWI